MHPPSGERRQLAAVLAVVLFLNLTVRTVFVCTFPLIITNDGHMYLQCAAELLDGHTTSLTPYRTPGYPAFLAAVLSIIAGPLAILIAQHTLATVAAIALSLGAYRLVPGRRGVAALVTGLGISLDPYLLMFGSYALSESVTISLVSIAAAATIRPKRPLIAVVVVALASSAAALCRPAAQVLIPFLILACTLAPGLTPRKRLTTPVLGCAVTLAVLVPWIQHNARRGVTGLAGGTGVVLFSNLARVGMLRSEDASPGESGLRLASAYASFEGRVLSEAELWEYLHGVGAFASAETDAHLSAWATQAIIARPGAYTLHATRALLWQMNMYPQAWSYTRSELNWFLVRLGVDGTTHGQREPNFQVNGLTAEQLLALSPFRGEIGDGPVVQGYRWLAERWPRGLPQVALGMCAAISAMLAIRDRRSDTRCWVWVVVLAGTLVFVALHAALVFPFARYSLPATAVWYLAAGDLVGRLVRNRHVRSACGQAQRDPGTQEQRAQPKPSKSSLRRLRWHGEPVHRM